jgi:hypothetical protein
MELKEKYPDVVVVGETTLPGLQPGERVMARLKKYEGEIIQEAFNLIRTLHDIRPIDILAFIDSDEMFTTNLPTLLQDFWKSKKDAMLIKPIEVFEDIHIICNRGLASHGKIYKYVPEISSCPYAAQNFYLPYRIKRNICKEPWNFVHMARLTLENRTLRQGLRNRVSDPELKLRRVSKPAYELTPAEAELVSLSDNFILLKDWSGKLKDVPLIL